MIQTIFGEFRFVLQETGQVRIMQGDQEILSDTFLLPWLAPPFVNCSDPSDDEGVGETPTLEEGDIRDEGVRHGRQHYRLTGVMRHPFRPEHRFEYQALLHIGMKPLLSVEYVRLRTLNGAVRLTHWEHSLCLAACQAALFSGLSRPQPAPIFDLVLLHGAQAPVLAAQDGGQWLLVSSPDLETTKQGALTLRREPKRPGIHRLGLHRISPDWAYSGAIHQTLEPVELAPGAALSFRFAFDIRDRKPAGDDLAFPPDTRSMTRRPARIFLLHGKSSSDNQAACLRRKIDFFTIPQGRFSGLHYGGYCHLNQRHLEGPVHRAEYAEYMLNEYFRSGDSWWLERVLRFVRVHLDAMYLADPGDRDHGGVRHRGSATIVNPVRSCRSANLLIHVYHLTDDPLYRQAAIANGDYILRRAAEAQARQAVACRELAVLWKQTGEERFAEGAREIVRRVAVYQKDDGAWHQWYDSEGKPGKSRQHEAGEYREEAPLKPEMATYNIIGLLDMVELLPFDLAETVARKALDWMLTVQSDRGGWHFPTYKSKGLWGHGAFQDALAMFRGYMHFKEERYFQAGRRVFDWAAHLLDSKGYIPTVVGVWPYEMSEASLTYFYGLEAAALLREIE